RRAPVWSWPRCCWVTKPSLPPSRNTPPSLTRRRARPFPSRFATASTRNCPSTARPRNFTSTRQAACNVQAAFSSPFGNTPMERLQRSATHYRDVVTPNGPVNLELTRLFNRDVLCCEVTLTVLVVTPHMAQLWENLVARVKVTTREV